MTGPDLKKLRSLYHSLLGYQRILEDLAAAKHYVVMDPSVGPLAADLAVLKRDFPDVAGDAQDLLGRLQETYSGEIGYDVSGLRALVARLLARIKTEIDDAAEVTPVTQARSFAFVKDAALRAILERDYLEIQRAFVAQCWKSAIILSGGALEAILLDVALANQGSAKVSPKAPKESDPRKWDLNDLIEVCVDLKLIGPYVKTVSDATRRYRNLVHPGVELRTKLGFAKEEAAIALNVLDMLHRDLSP